LFTTVWWNTVAKTSHQKQIRHWSFTRGEWWEDGDMQYCIYVADNRRCVTLFYESEATRDADFLRFVPNKELTDKQPARAGEGEESLESI